jgi:hypothetical protein
MHEELRASLLAGALPTVAGFSDSGYSPLAAQ